MAEPKVRPEFRLDDAESVAGAVFRLLEPHVKRLMIVGSIRRRRPIVHDIDMVVEPHPGGEGRVQLAKAILDNEIADKGELTAPEKIWKCLCTGIQLELYLATPETWAGLLVVRTGSASHNVLIASTAKRRGLQWKASGEGFLDSTGHMVPVRSEEDVFRILEMTYRHPVQREA